MRQFSALNILYASSIQGADINKIKIYFLHDVLLNSVWCKLNGYSRDVFIEKGRKF